MSVIKDMYFTGARTGIERGEIFYSANDNRSKQHPELIETMYVEYGLHCFDESQCVANSNKFYVARRLVLRVLNFVYTVLGQTHSPP